MKFAKTLSIILILLLFQGHSFAQKKGKLTPDEKEKLKNAKVMIYRFEAPPLNFMTPKDAVGEGLVADITKSDEANQHERHRFYPSKLVQYKLDSLWKAEGIFTNAELVEEAFDFHMPAKLKDFSRYSDVDADYIVEVIVPLMGWQASYSPTKWRTYSLNLGVEVRIIRKSDLTRVWKTNAGYGGLNDKNLKFHITELEENGKEKIADMLTIAVTANSKKIVEQYVRAKK